MLALRRACPAPILAAVFLVACGRAAEPDLDWPATPVPTPAGLVDATDPQPISDIAWRHGEARWSRDGEGDPLIEATADGRPYQIEFYGCVEGRDCKEIRFVARFDPPEGGALAADAEAVARWSSANRMGEAALGEDGSARLELNVSLQGGVTRQNLDATFQWWRRIMADFTRFLGLPKG